MLGGSPLTALQLLRAVASSDTLGNPSSFLQGSTVAGRFSLLPLPSLTFTLHRSFPLCFCISSPQKACPLVTCWADPTSLLKRHSLRDAYADLCLKHCSDSIFPARLLVLRSYFLLFITCHFFNCYNLPVYHVYGLFSALRYLWFTDVAQYLDQQVKTGMLSGSVGPASNSDFRLRS